MQQRILLYLVKARLWCEGIPLTARTYLVILNNGNLNAKRYIQDTLEKHVVPFAPYIDLVHGNARSHTARVVQNYLLDVSIETMAWAARSPDLNPIEHVWDILVRQLHTHPNQLNNIADVEQLLIEI